MGVDVGMLEPVAGTELSAMIGGSDFVDVAIQSPRGTLDCKIHIVDPDAALRASTFRMLTALGYRCEIYASVSELVSFRPSGGIVFLHESEGGPSVAATSANFRAAGLALNFVGCAKNPDIAQVVRAMKAGALDYLPMPFEAEHLQRAIEGFAKEDAALQRNHQEIMDADLRIRSLSVRERQVLDLVGEGNSNKAIARRLDISPRTVEIHRMKMMGKLGASNAADAVRLWLIARTV